MQANAGYRYVGIRTVEQIAGLALIRIHLSWESFLEETFTRYICSASTQSGYSPRLKSVAYSNMKQAKRKLVGQRRYISWSIDSTLARSRRYFVDGEPFTSTISAVRQTLEDISVVRNRLAHASEYAVSEFRKVVIKHLGYVAKGMTPGRFLLWVVPHPGPKTHTVLEYFAENLIGAAWLIVP